MSLKEANMLESNMKEEVRKRVAPVLKETWRSFNIYLGAYIHPEDLKSFEDFNDVFEHLIEHDYIRLGFYEPIQRALSQCDAPSAREIKDSQQKILSALSREEKERLERWKNEKRLESVSEDDKSVLDLEADMLNYVKGRVGPRNKTMWGTFTNYLRTYVTSVADIKSCSDIADSFYLLRQHADIENGEYEAFYDILDNCDKPSSRKVSEYKDRIQKKLKEAELKFDQRKQTTSLANSSMLYKRHLEDEAEVSSSKRQCEPLHKKEETALEVKALEDIIEGKQYHAIGRLIVKWGDDENYRKKGTGFLVEGAHIMTAYHLFEDVIDQAWEKIAGILHTSCKEDYVAKQLALTGNITTFLKLINQWRKHNKNAQFEDIIKICQSHEDLKSHAERIRNFLKEIWTSIIQLGYIRDDSPYKEFQFEYQLPFYDAERDVIILKLDQNNPNFSSIPEALPLKIAREKEFHVIGHPNGNRLVADFRCKTLTKQNRATQMDEAIKWCMEQEWFKNGTISLETLQNDYLPCKITDDEDDTNIAFHCDRNVEHGASGSPCIVYYRKTASVNAMYLESCPKFYHSNNLSDNQKKSFPSEKLFEFAISMKSVFDLLVNRGKNDLAQQLFDPTNGSR